MYVIFALTAIVIWLSYHYMFKRPTNFPPGPFYLPIIGSIHITRDIPHLACQELAKKYGPTLGIKFANQWSIMLHDPKMIREAFNETGVSGRQPTEATSFLLGDEFGILQASGEVWSDQRRFAMRTLRDFGFGKASMEEMISDEAQEFCDWLKKQGGAPVELKRRFGLAVVNSLWRILTGERYEHDDPALVDILDKLESTQKELLDFTAPLKVALLFFYPNIARMFPSYSGWLRLEETAKSRTDLFDKIIREHSETLEAGNPRDFVDMYLQEIQKTDNDASSFHPSIGKHSLRSVISDLFLAGSDTTSVTLLWAILYLLHYPDVQEKMQQELDSVLDTRPPSLTDRKRLPYLECVIMEVLRCSSIVPIGVAHMAVQDVKIGGYDIPSGTMVNANVYHVHHDPEVRGDPHVFRPERFLNADGTCMGRHESLMPFSVGRRACMGENLARDSLFIFTALMVQNFSVTLPPNEKEKPTLTAKTGHITLQPHPFKVSMKYRF